MMKVIPKLNCDRFDPRFVIADDNGKIMDDAKGWGYKTQEKARKAMWYKFGGGKQKIDDSKKKMRAEVSSFEAKHNGIGKFIEQFDETWFKEFARGEIDENDLLDAIEEKFGTRLTVYQLECFGET